MNILITSAGRRVSLVRAFKNELVKFFPKGRIFTADMKPELSSACSVSDGYFSVVRVTDPAYSEKLIEICLANNIKLIVPTIDTELIPLAENVELFLNNGIQPVISSVEIVRICRDKRKLFSFFDSIGFPRTREIDFTNPEFPIFAKPVDGSSSIGTRIITENSHLPGDASEDKKMVFLKFLSPLDYTEFTIDLYFDKNSWLKCAVPRERLEVRSGEVTKAVTRKDDLYKKIRSAFSYCNGFVGCITLQVFRHRNSNEIIGIEINPRFGGGYPLSYLAGADYPEYLIREYLLNENIQFFDNWTSDMLMLRYDDEIIVYDYKG
ncbi:MAG: ATP-grasp domain-containing protein [Bacteroidia bacterium]|nr:ATP-grasp domain-containing protein [Bacteroidia bacterium]